jgi:hypothetical protein
MNASRSFTRFYAAPVVIMVLAYMLPMAAVGAAVRSGDPQVLKARQEVMSRIGSAGPIATVARQLHEGRYVRAVLTVFAWNFGVAALGVSILAGAVCFAVPPLVGVTRGVLLGLLYEPSALEGGRAVVAVGTAVLELPPYMIAGALGMRLGLAWLFPPRRERLEEAWEHARWTVPVVALLLFVAAVWEVVGLALVGPKP